MLAIKWKKHVNYCIVIRKMLAWAYRNIFQVESWRHSIILSSNVLWNWSLQLNTVEAEYAVFTSECRISTKEKLLFQKYLAHTHFFLSKRKPNFPLQQQLRRLGSEFLGESFSDVPFLSENIACSLFSFLFKGFETLKNSGQTKIDAKWFIQASTNRRNKKTVGKATAKQLSREARENLRSKFSLFISKAEAKASQCARQSFASPEIFPSLREFSSRECTLYTVEKLQSYFGPQHGKYFRVKEEQLSIFIKVLQSSFEELWIKRCVMLIALSLTSLATWLCNEKRNICDENRVFQVSSLSKQLEGKVVREKSSLSSIFNFLLHVAFVSLRAWQFTTKLGLHNLCQLDFKCFVW